MSGVWKALLGLLYPEKCACCRAVTGTGPLCSACADKLHRLHAVERRPRYSGDTDRIVAVYAYSGAGGALMRAYKFRGRKSCFEWLRPEFEELCAECFAGEHIDAVLPVPMYRAAKKQRGFNQAEAIAQGLAARLCVPYRADLLEKRRGNRTQHKLPAGERRENVKSVYEVHGEHGELAGKTVLVVDDIVTTGATFSACARALRTSGASRVLCAAVLAAE